MDVNDDNETKVYLEQKLGGKGLKKINQGQTKPRKSALKKTNTKQEKKKNKK